MDKTEMYGSIIREANVGEGAALLGRNSNTAERRHVKYVIGSLAAVALIVCGAFAFATYDVTTEATTDKSGVVPGSLGYSMPSVGLLEGENPAEHATEADLLTTSGFELQTTDDNLKVELMAEYRAEAQRKMEEAYEANEKMEAAIQARFDAHAYDLSPPAQTNIVGQTLAKQVQQDQEFVAKYNISQAKAAARAAARIGRGRRARPTSYADRFAEAHGQASDINSAVHKGMGTDATFCWRDSYGRGAGTLPKSCPSGKELIADGVLCYDKCDVKFGNEFYRYGYDCHQRCKSGWDDHGLLCHKGNWGRGVGTVACGFNAESSSALGGGSENNTTSFRRLLGGIRFPTCGGHHCTNQNKQDCLGLCYPKCPSSHPDWIGCNLCAVNCKSAGYHGGIAPSCMKKIHVSPGIEGARCQDGWDMDAGLCYKKCKAGYRGAGPVCWGSAPKVKTSSGEIKQFVECGMGAATDDAECAAVMADQILGPLEVVAFVATAGSSSTAAMGAKGASRASLKVVNAGGKAKAMRRAGADLKKAFKDGLKDNVKGFDAEGAEDLYGVLDSMTTVTTETDAIRAAAELAALVDPTGVSGTVAAYAHDLCTRIMHQ